MGSCGSGSDQISSKLSKLLGKTTTTTTTTDTTTTTSSSSSSSKLSSLLSSLGGGNSTVNSLLDMVIGKTSITQDQLVGTWEYVEPGVAFTSENLLSEAGGAVAAAQVKEKLSDAYDKVGVSASNTYFTFESDNSFKAKIDGISFSGSYTLDSDEGQIKFKATLLSITGYVTRTTNGVAITFESKKLIQQLQTLSSLSGNSTLKTLSSLSSDIDGVRIGVDTKQK